MGRGWQFQPGQGRDGEGQARSQDEGHGRSSQYRPITRAAARHDLSGRSGGSLLPGSSLCGGRREDTERSPDLARRPRERHAEAVSTGGSGNYSTNSESATGAIRAGTTGILFVVPALILYAAFVLWPLASSVYYSMTD